MHDCGLWILETDLDTRTHTHTHDIPELTSGSRMPTLLKAPLLYSVWVSSCLANVCFCFPISTSRSKRDRSKPISFAWTKDANRLQPSDMFQLECSFHVLLFLSRNLHLRYQQNLHKPSINYIYIYIFLDLNSTSTIFAWKSFKDL